MDKWTLVEDALPTDGEIVLCWCEFFKFGSRETYRMSRVGYVQYDGWHGDVRSGILKRVIAWMPLPKPPEGFE